MKTIICYSNKSSVTGRLLAAKLDALRKRTNRKAKCDALLRWGSLETFDRLRAKVELNSRDAVANAVNKLNMLRLLTEANIKTVEYNNDPALIATYLDESGNCYIRSNSGVVRYANNFNALYDSYYSKPVLNKRREYRVHVFDGRVIGLYEKVPTTEGDRPKLFKSDTCNFVRCNPEISRVKQPDLDMCIAAVNSLGLLFGGVDLIRDNKMNCFICEVNSSPGLNSQMIDKYVHEINQYVTNMGVV